MFINFFYLISPRLVANLNPVWNLPSHRTTFHKPPPLNIFLWYGISEKLFASGLYIYAKTQSLREILCTANFVEISLT